VKPLLELHDCSPDEALLDRPVSRGAYQEVMGNLHNLFGSTNAVQYPSWCPLASYRVDYVVEGNTNAEVLEAYGTRTPTNCLSVCRRPVRRHRPGQTCNSRDAPAADGPTWKAACARPDFYLQT